MTALSAVSFVRGGLKRIYHLKTLKPDKNVFV